MPFESARGRRRSAAISCQLIVDPPFAGGTREAGSEEESEESNLTCFFVLLNEFSLARRIERRILRYAREICFYFSDESPPREKSASNYRISRDSFPPPLSLPFFSITSAVIESAHFKWISFLSSILRTLLSFSFPLLPSFCRCKEAGFYETVRTGDYVARQAFTAAIERRCTVRTFLISSGFSRGLDIRSAE